MATVDNRLRKKMKVSHKSFDGTTGKFQFQSARPPGSSVGLVWGQLVIEPSSTQTHWLPCVSPAALFCACFCGCMCVSLCDFSLNWGNRVRINKQKGIFMMLSKPHSPAHVDKLAAEMNYAWTLKTSNHRKLTMTGWSPTSCSHTLKLTSQCSRIAQISSLILLNKKLFYCDYFSLAHPHLLQLVSVFYNQSQFF